MQEGWVCPKCGGVNVGSLFSGIGGLDLGLERAGMECCWQCEIDTAAQSVLRRHWPDAVLYDDVTTLGGDVEPVDLICGGFPCQDLSVAGRRAGLAGERSGLWYQFHRILGELAPRWVLVENVPGLLSSNAGRDFAVVLRGMVELGYGVAWRILDAQFFGVAQRRRRVFIVGCLGDSARAAQVLFEPESLPGNPPPSREAGERVTQSLTGGPSSSSCGNPDDNRAQGGFLVAHGLTARHDSSEDGTGRGTPLVTATLTSNGDAHSGFRLGDGIASLAQNQRGELRTADISPQLTCGGGEPGEGYPCVAFEPGSIARNAGPAGESPQCPTLRSDMGDNQPAIRLGMAVRRLTPTECERLQGFPDGWTDGQSDSARYRQLGNAVCVPVAEWIGRRIMAVASSLPPPGPTTTSGVLV